MRSREASVVGLNAKGILFDLDVRRLKNDTLINGTWHVGSVQTVRSPFGPLVFIAEVLPSAKRAARPLPRVLNVAGRRYTRLLDRYYLPTEPNVAVSTACFDLLASDYEAAIDVRRNKANIRRLLRTIVGAVSAPARLRVLDFGCGTGLVTEVVSEQLRCGGRMIDILGTDVSPRMLEAAARRGLAVMNREQWVARERGCFDGILLSYVMHAGMDNSDISILASQLADHGLLVGNYHHGHERAIASLAARFGAAGLSLMEVRPSRAKGRNPVLVFRRSIGSVE